MQPRPKRDTGRVLNVDHRACVLVVDGDRVSERSIELALAQCDYAIEWARDGESALDIMRRTKVDVVISDSTLSDMPGSTLMHRTTDLCGPGAPSFLFVSVDRATVTRVNLLVNGATDYLVKPFVPEELRARVVNTIESRRAARAIATRGVTGLAGDASHIPIADLLTMLEFARKTGVVYISVGPALGRLVIDGGRVIHAEIGNLAGQHAFFALLQYSGGLFRFQPGAVESPHTLNARVSELLLESAVHEDTNKHRVDQEALRRTEAGLRELGIVKTPIALRSRRPSTPLPQPIGTAAQKLAIAIADPMILGDLILANEVAPATGGEYRIELWASTPEGVAAMLGLASPPGHQFIVAALSNASERLHLQFEIVNVTLVMTLVDTEGRVDLPTTRPHGIIVAPPRGELIALAPQRLSELTLRVAAPGRTAVIALGGQALQSTVSSLDEERRRGVRILGINDTIEGDLRDKIGGLISLWMASRESHG